MQDNSLNVTQEEDKEYKPKNIVICCDGTGNEYGKQNTNVVKLFQRLKLKNPEEQIAYYDPGVGTFSSPAAFTKTAKFVSRVKGLAFASGITQNIEDAYIYLMDKYRKGDKVYLFGFSRGAYTARALGGMLNKCGLLQKGSNNLVPYASKLYRKDDGGIAKGFKKTFSRICNPHFIGVWDTVASIGFSLFRRKFSDSVLNPDVKFGYQALAVDEKRWKFKPDIWCPPADAVKDKQIIEQVWFAGVHSDIGGSYKDPSLSNISLNWMLRQAQNRDLLIREDELSGRDFVPEPCGKLSNSLLPFWWISGWKRRDIKDGSSMHKSVYDRRGDSDCGYNPKNLPKNPVIVE